MEFITGEYVMLNTPNHPSVDGKRGMIAQIDKELVKGKFFWSKDEEVYNIVVSVKLDDRFVTYNVSPNQLKKCRQLDTAYEKFKTGFIAETEAMAIARDDQTSEEDRIAKEANDHIKVHKIGRVEGYYEGYEKGYQDAIAKVLDIFKEKGW